MTTRRTKRFAEKDVDQLDTRKWKKQLSKELRDHSWGSAFDLFYDAGNFSDMRVTCQGLEWKLHRSILMPRCEFFRACCARYFKECDDNVISMDDDHPEALDCYLEFLYTSTIPWRIKSCQAYNVCPRTHSLDAIGFHELVIRTFQIADKYDEPLLMDIARHQALSFTDDEDYGYGELFEAIDLLRSMGEAPNILSFRSQLMAKLITVRGSLHKLEIDDDDVELPESVQVIIKQNPEMAFELLLKSWQHLGLETKRREEAERALRKHRPAPADHKPPALQRKVVDNPESESDGC